MSKSKCCLGWMAGLILVATLLGLAGLDLVWSQPPPPPGPAPTRPVILEFSRKVCPICRETEQVLLRLQSEKGNQFEVKILYIDEDIKLFRQYQVAIVPTQVFLDAGGKKVFRHEGPLSRKQLIRELRKLKFISD
ncbi:MAG: thioredoxin family protein [Deltaproteobacteria bacterium]|nr:thioredoxin family protein [Deltaproteobacteria bacterium]